MNKLCIFVTLTVFSYLGWWLGAPYGIYAAFAFSSTMSLFGVYAGWRINRDYLE
ncbi:MULTISPECIES: hypothetical protein [unclassified Lentimonas]|uniref:hypothetical protein n=1 Tax=unclassified Lentimonas TaxID=2630993 RepID=UPI0013220023|nr:MULTISPECIES: hypothetical protein [unclassified Lentimonas]CAA6685627.1 Unannotated [Lentimonas sp. CC6]CAA7168847.1 Unannotated [Lentimonas sp. CC21]CAA6679859.1 Unannotated [Lentimonas sp. CC4]CAA7077072.1 Unannotated [Lentimonas sp. CC4]CAA7180790.1 Unannotated [Lentimonas sp. CC8]